MTAWRARIFGRLLPNEGPFATGSVAIGEFVVAYTAELTKRAKDLQAEMKLLPPTPDGLRRAQEIEGRLHGMALASGLAVTMLQNLRDVRAR